MFAIKVKVKGYFVDRWGDWALTMFNRVGEMFVGRRKGGAI